MVGMAGIIYGSLTLWFARENRLRDGGKVKPDHESLSDEELQELGDESPRFRYQT